MEWGQEKNQYSAWIWNLSHWENHDAVNWNERIVFRDFWDSIVAVGIKKVFV